VRETDGLTRIESVFVVAVALALGLAYNVIVGVF
jgi:hypothetical protein